jgi:hypothetical protein
MKQALLVACATIAVSMAAAQGETLTQFFSTSDLTALSQGPNVMNLAAQSLKKKPVADLNTFDDFFLINGTGTLVVNFDHALKNKGEVKIPGWVGAAAYSNHDIKTDLTAGFQAVMKAYAPKGMLANLVVYKTLNTSQMVYDYAFTIPGSQSCQEYLYVPALGSTELGMTKGCYWKLKDFTGKAGSAGKLKAGK